MIIVNIKNIYSNCMHLPLPKATSEADKDKRSPLYGIVTTGYEDDETRHINKTEAWLSLTKHTYNSPTNVRRVILTDEYAVIQFYKPFIHKGQPVSTGNWRVVSLKSHSIPSFKKDFLSFWMRVGNGNVSFEQIRTYKNKPENLVKFTGCMVDGIRMPWVLSNIEEVIVDDTFLFSERFLELSQSCGVRVSHVYKWYAHKSVSDLDRITDLVFKALFGMTDEDLKAKFNRLRTVSVIPGLGKILDSDEYSKYNNKTTKCLFDELAEVGKIDKEKCLSVKLIPDSKLDTGKFSLRTHYKFDKEVLSEFARTFEDDLAAIRKLESMKETEVTVTIKPDYEDLLDEIAANQSLEDAKIVFKVALGCSNEADRKEILANMTADGRAKYVG